MVKVSNSGLIALPAFCGRSIVQSPARNPGIEVRRRRK